MEIKVKTNFSEESIHYSCDRYHTTVIETNVYAYLCECVRKNFHVSHMVIAFWIDASNRSVRQRFCGSQCLVWFRQVRLNRNRVAQAQLHPLSLSTFTYLRLFRAAHTIAYSYVGENRCPFCSFQCCKFKETFRHKESNNSHPNCWWIDNKEIEAITFDFNFQPMLVPSIKETLSVLKTNILK